MRIVESDVCIVGSGVAGAIVARRCVASGLRVAMVEAGSGANGRALRLRVLERTVRDFRIPRMAVWHRRARYRTDEYTSRGNRGYRLRGKALVVRGGSTLGWAGFAFRHMPEDFRLHSSTGLGIDWPIDYADLEPYYVLAEQSLRVAGDEHDVGHPPRSGPFPVAPIPFHRRDQPFLSLVTASDWSAMHNNVSLAPDGGAFTTDALIDELETFPDFSLLTQSTALRIVGSSSESAAGVECRNLVDGSSTEIRARAIVVAAGGIESPNLLQISAGRWWPDGLGNHSGQLGRNLINHIGCGVGAGRVAYASRVVRFQPRRSLAISIHRMSNRGASTSSDGFRPRAG